MKTQAKRIWKAFRDAGVTEDDEIVTHVAVVLTRHFDHIHTSIRPPLSEETPDHIAHLIRKAVEHAPLKAGQLLDSIVEARLASKGETSQFASSKALRDILYLLLDVQPTHDLLDPACGTGWLLATRGSASGKTVGYEISPLWAFIADLSPDHSSAFLNGCPKARRWVALTARHDGAGGLRGQVHSGARRPCGHGGSLTVRAASTARLSW